MAATRPAPLRVLLTCSGLDHAHRGFESFARECFQALRSDPRLEITLLKGSGPSRAGEQAIPTLLRDAAAARVLARVWGREPFRVEQLAFGASLLPEIARRRPHVVYFSEWHTGLVLGRYRGLGRNWPRLVLCNGAMAAEGFAHLDLVQQLTPVALQAALERGDITSRHVLLPLGFALGREFSPPSTADRSALRTRLGLPADRRIVLSVAALNRYHKRLDYLIRELSLLPSPRPFLLLVGEQEAETPGLRALANELLGDAAYAIRTVPYEQVSDLYRVSDVLVLASLGEAFGRVLVEGMAQGLPCAAHDSEITRYVLGEHGFVGDLSERGALAQLLRTVADEDPSRAAARHRFVYERFSWDRLRPRYVTLLQAAAGRAQPDTVANSTVSSSSGDAVWMKQR